MVYKMSRMISNTKQGTFKRVSNIICTSSRRKTEVSLFQEAIKTEIISEKFGVLS